MERRARTQHIAHTLCRLAPPTGGHGRGRDGAPQVALVPAARPEGESRPADGDAGLKVNLSHTLVFRVAPVFTVTLPLYSASGYLNMWILPNHGSVALFQTISCVRCYIPLHRQTKGKARSWIVSHSLIVSRAQEAPSRLAAAPYRGTVTSGRHHPRHLEPLHRLTPCALPLCLCTPMDAPHS